VAGSAGSNPRAVHWTTNGTATQLGAFPEGNGDGRGLGINEAGQVVGWIRGDGYSPRPFLWHPTTGLRELATNRSDGGDARAINELGHVVGELDGDGAFLWRDGQLTIIGPSSSAAYAINDLDHVVGDFYADSRRAFIYRDGVLTDLNTLVPPGTARLTDARGINNAGQIVVNGIDPATGHRRAYLLNPS
jgi:probable HAF family extracellular repeat protein